MLDAQQHNTAANYGTSAYGPSMTGHELNTTRLDPSMRAALLCGLLRTINNLQSIYPPQKAESRR